MQKKFVVDPNSDYTFHEGIFSNKGLQRASLEQFNEINANRQQRLSGLVEECCSLEREAGLHEVAHRRSKTLGSGSGICLRCAYAKVENREARKKLIIASELLRQYRAEISVNQMMETRHLTNRFRERGSFKLGLVLAFGIGASFVTSFWFPMFGWVHFLTLSALFFLVARWAWLAGVAYVDQLWTFDRMFRTQSSDKQDAEFHPFTQEEIESGEITSRTS